MLRLEEPNNMRVPRHRYDHSFDTKYKHSSIRKRQPCIIIHANIGTLKNVRSINTKSNLDKQPSNTINNHQYKEKQTNLSIIQNPKISKKISIHPASINKVSPCHLFQQNGNATKHLLLQVNSSMKTPDQNVIIGYDEDGKSMTNNYHQKPKNNKKSICSRRCVITSIFITLLIILIITAILLGVLIKPKSTTLRSDTPVLRWNLSGITVAGIGNNSVGQTVAGNGTAGSSPYQLWFPRRVILDSNGGLYVADSPNNRIQLWSNGSTSGTTVAGSAVGTYGNASNRLNYPYGIVLNPTSGELYISDGNNNRIMSYASGANNGTLLFGGKGPGNNNTQLNYPFGLHFDSFSNKFTSANAGANNVVQYISGGSSWSLVAGDINGTAGATSTRLTGPMEVTFDSMGNTYVADVKNHRIQFFYAGQSNGITIAGLSGVSGSNVTALYEPRSVRLDNQLNLYVADSANHRIQKFLRY